MAYTVRPIEAKTLLTKATGFAGDGIYTHTLNPYSGCAFACRYCYMRTFPVQRYRDEPWGTWVDAKVNAPTLYLREARALRRRGRPIRLFMASGTDPYQGAEPRLRVTRGLLEAMLDAPPDHLTVQTRSLLVADDLAQLRSLSARCAVRVSITVETDREPIRRLFAPTAPSIAARVKALRAVHDAGIETQAAVSPLLPCTRDFPELLRGSVDRVVLDTLRVGDGAQGRRSAELGMPELFRAHGLARWYGPDVHLRAARRFAEVFGAQAVHTLAGDF